MADIWDSNELKNSTLFWQPFVIKPDGTFEIHNLDEWNMEVFDTYEGDLDKPTLSLADEGGAKILHWRPVKGADGYRVFKNGTPIKVISGQSYALPLSLAGTSYSCAIEAFTIRDKCSGRSDKIEVIWSKAKDDYLSRYEPDSWTQGYGVLQIDQAIEGNPLQVGEQLFERGFGVHAVSEVRFTINDRYSRFTSWVGVDAYTRFNDFASVEFIVKGDGKELFNSGLMTVRDPAKFVDISLEGVHTLELIVTDGGKHETRWDHADWGDPKIYK